MGDLIAIEVNSVSKEFKKHTEPAKTLKERVITWRKSETSTFHALTDVSFNVAVGESIGILGHNGSGKSTLLKTIAGTIRPSTGSVRVRGRLAALLELGAGFHPDLTGRENVYLNGSVLGFSREQIDEIFDEIVEFSELGDFIHTQVKHYSSGMYARLGFAVAINLQPDVLLVDEVLAVGDEAFQRKCIARINEFQQKQRTLLLVTHSPDQVADLCDRAVVLDHGNAIYVGDPVEAVEIYRRSIHGENYSELNLTTHSVASGHNISVKEARVTSADGPGTVKPGMPFRIEVDLFSTIETDAQLRILVHNHENLEVLNLASVALTGELSKVKSGAQTVTVDIAASTLAAGVYAVSFLATDRDGEVVHAQVEKATKFNVVAESPDTGRVWVSADFRINKTA